MGGGSPVKPISFDVAKFLACNGYAETVSFASLPPAYRESMRRYVSDGILPGHTLTTLLQGHIQAVRLFRNDLTALLAIADWLHSELPAVCWGTPDQVQRWCAFARHQRKANDQ